MNSCSAFLEGQQQVFTVSSARDRVHLARVSARPWMERLSMHSLALPSVRRWALWSESWTCRPRSSPDRRPEGDARLHTQPKARAVCRGGQHLMCVPGYARADRPPESCRSWCCCAWTDCRFRQKPCTVMSRRHSKSCRVVPCRVASLCTQRHVRDRLHGTGADRPRAAHGTRHTAPTSSC